MGEKHSWNDLENYLHVAQRALDDHPFVIDHGLQIEVSPEVGRISGEIVCHGAVVVDVVKHFEIRTVRGRKQARTVGYSYHARRESGSDILRYDNVHQQRRHPTPHHRHEFGERGERISHVGLDWPHLGEVLDELQSMFWGEANT